MSKLFSDRRRSITRSSVSTSGGSGAADLEIVRREAEAAAELVELLQRRQALVRVLADQVLAGNQKIGVRAHIGAADAAAQLVELREAEGVGAVDDDRVGARDV